MSGRLQVINQCQGGQIPQIPNFGGVHGHAFSSRTRKIYSSACGRGNAATRSVFVWDGGSPSERVLHRGHARVLFTDPRVDLLRRPAIIRIIARQLSQPLKPSVADCKDVMRHACPATAAVDCGPLDKSLIYSGPQKRCVGGCGGHRVPPTHPFIHLPENMPSCTPFRQISQAPCDICQLFPVVDAKSSLDRALNGNHISGCVAFVSAAWA